MTSYIGQCACYFSLQKFLGLGKDEWVKKMKKNSSRISPYPAEDSQIKAWEDCYDVLKLALWNLPSGFLNLHVVFEYVLPQHAPGTKKSEVDQGIRADVLLLGKNTVCVLELKQREDIYLGHVRQARKYRNRIQNFHKKSIGMNKKAFLLLTKAENLSKKYSKVCVCSPDVLREELIDVFGDSPECRTGGEVEEWLTSDFVRRYE